jgi:aryl-alcohol dehydrogenase-like predicted oxidoreductase
LKKIAPSFAKNKTVQNPYSLLNRLLSSSAEICVREDGLLAYSPMAFLGFIWKILDGEK